MKRPIRISLVLGLALLVATQADPELALEREVTPIGTNAYVLYDPASAEAALLDVAGPIDTLEAFIQEHGLRLKYFIFTHGHFDHVIGLPAIKDRYPEAQVVIHEDDFVDMQTQLQWVLDNMGREFIDFLKSDPERAKLLEFDARTFGEPDILIEDGQVLRLGEHEVRAIHSPGHSRGSVCYYTDGMLFSGDVLFYRTVGRTDVQNSSLEHQIVSVRRLYKLPAETVVYPAHGRATDIGAERTENERITIDAVNMR